MPVCIHMVVFENTHTHSNVRVTTAASETESVAAVSWIESLMIRRPLGSIDPNSIRETEHVCTWYQRALRYQLRGRPFQPWAGRLRFYVCTWYQPAQIYTYVRYVPPVDAHV